MDLSYTHIYIYLCMYMYILQFTSTPIFCCRRKTYHADIESADNEDSEDVVFGFERTLFFYSPCRLRAAHNESRFT